jgi:acyl-CoA thioesterase
VTGATAFDRAIAITPQGDGAYAAVSSPDWSAPNGPHGGYVAAIVMRAMEAELADPSRPARSLTLHYARAPKHAPLVVEVAVERTGRNLSTLSARLVQDGQVCVLALAAFAVAFPEIERFTAAMPDVPPAEAIPPWPVRPGVPSIASRVEFRGAIGALPFTGADEALTGGWMRMHEPQPLDAAALALYADAWLPAVFSRVHEPIGAPTIDLTIHFRDPAAALAVDPGAAILGVFRSKYASDGFVEEDGELWSPDGTLLAHSRQLALLRDLR